MSSYFDQDQEELTSAAEKAIMKLNNNEFPLKHLELNGYYLRDSGVKKICKEVASHKTLESLTFFDNSYGVPGRIAICKMLELNQHLSRLSIISGGFDYIQGIMLFKALKSHPCLRELDLREASIGDPGAIAAADYLKINTSLNYLGLYYCFMSDVGAIAIAEALKINKSLKQLCLDYNNKIGSFGIKEIADALQDNTSLTYLSMLNCNIKQDDVIILRQAQKKNNTLESLAIETYIKRTLD
jgi:Ran GTPase-activating protein (RanGAP) involved in mRNA processing and transport